MPRKSNIPRDLQGARSSSDDCPIQILGSDGNVITVPTSILIQAGINVRDSEELSHQQVENVLSLMNSTQSEPHPSTSENAKRKRVHSLGDHQSEENQQQATFTISGTEDGGLELTDSVNERNFYFSPSQLAESGISIENGELSHAALSQIIQLTVTMGADDGETRGRREGEGNLPVISKKGKKSESKPGTSRINDRPDASAEIGDKVQFRSAGKLQEATVRYVRTQTGYKVQFDDGHFEWIDESDLVTNVDPGDHHRYSGVPHAGIINRSHKMAEKEEETFCCPICTRKVNQKRAAYIVIRIPACDDCSKEKVMVLDEENENGQQ